MEKPVQDMVNHTLLSVAGVHVVSLPPEQHEKELEAFIQPFIDDARKFGVIIPQETKEMLRQIIYVDRLSMKAGAGVIAACNRYYTYQQTLSGKRKLEWMTIEVLRKESLDYTGTDPQERQVLLKEVVYHELFHCFLNKGHLPPGKSGIMSATLVKGSRRAFLEWDALVEEMFSKEYLDLIPPAS